MYENLKKYKILLASKSPRRRELLQQLRLPFGIISVKGVEERYPLDIDPFEAAQYVSELKADACIKMLSEEDLVITADTMVILGQRIMGKPHDRKEALEMIMELSGKTHAVTTGVTIATKDMRTSFTSVTEVDFAEISQEEAEYYVNTFEPFDKAGAYGIQEWIGCVGVSVIRGSYYNVMGLPVHRLYQELKKF